jgi:hypothetical protein
VRVNVVAACGLLGVVLAGCGAGQDASTAQDLPSVPGVSASLDGIAVRNATVPAGGGYEVGGAAPIEFTLVNETDGVIRLVSAASELAASVEVAGGGTVAVPAFGLLPVTLDATGLVENLDGTSSLPLELTFDGSVVVSLDVPVAPPAVPEPRGEPIDVNHH